LAPGPGEGPGRLAERLGADGWNRVSLVTAPGEFSSRGDILDLFPPGSPAPLRLEYFGDDLESIRSFDPGTQRATGRRDRAEFPALLADAGMGTLLDHFRPDDPVFLIEPDAGSRALAESRPGADLDALKEGDHVLHVQQVEPVAAGAEGLVERVVEACAGMRRACFACRNDAEETRVRHLLGERTPEVLAFVRGRLSRSFRVPEKGLAVFGYDDLLQHLTRRRPAPRRAPGRAMDDFLDLEAGDLVVHLAHGIGVFRGLERIEQDGASAEHCVVEFREGVKVYVPVSKIDLVQKYVGSPGSRPALGKVGASAWARAKGRVKEAVRDLAVRLLDVQALRRNRPGIAFPADDAFQHEFEASFPYEETSDQITTMASVKSDMEAPRPMDRLLCGDVGYGKTELAMRAAFKVVQAGKQVAVLVPTTVLAQQHLQTFRERTSGFPVRVDVLSRFRSEKEQRDVLDDLAGGAVDILIGTHRIIQKDIRFKDLGLAIIDEEQRFGVAHKERLKQLRSEVDVLT
ncbi:MAG: DEAD/DEAH box helicase, partial [Planctomycetota bacterium]